MDAESRIKRAIEIAVQYGGIDGAHHKDWVINQMVMALTGCKGQRKSKEYRKLVADAKAGADGPDTYSWDEGIAP